MTRALSVEDVLGIRFPSDVAFDTAGRWLGWMWRDGSSVDVWFATIGDADGVGAPIRATTSGSVSSWAPRPGGGLAWTDHRGIGLLDATMAAEPPLDVGPAHHLVVSPHRAEIAAVVDRRVVTWLPGQDAVVHDLAAQAGIINPGPATALRWSPDGGHLAVATTDEGHRGLLVIDRRGTERWRFARTDGFVTGFCWLDDHQVSITVDRPPLDRLHQLVSIAHGTVTTILHERGDPVIGGAGAHGFPVPTVASPGGDHLVITRYRNGWAHLDLWDVATSTLVPLTHGAHDDAGGGRFDHPRWSHDGSSLVFCSSRDDESARQLWRLEIDAHASTRPRAGRLERLTAVPGTSWWPVPRPLPSDGTARPVMDLAFLHAGPHHSPDVWLLDSSSARTVQVTRSMPDGWHGATTAPRHVLLPGDDGTPVHAELYVEGELDPQRPRPALVFAHGGTIDQMRHGWHPGLPYLAPMSWHQWLVRHGWVVLTVDYRGSGGHGLDYQMALWGRMGDVDVADCVAAGRWLADLDGVASSAVGIWGISYGGYLTLAALTMHPGVFAAGISIAGVWDWEVVRDERATSDVLLSLTGAYRMTRGAAGSEADERWVAASPSAAAERLDAPLLVLHGTGDTKVTMSQPELLVDRLEALGKDLEVVAYPGEPHVFSARETWRDAYERMEAFLDRHVAARAGARWRRSAHSAAASDAASDGASRR